MFENPDPAMPDSSDDESAADRPDLAVERLVAAFGGGELVRVRAARQHPLTAA